MDSSAVAESQMPHRRSTDRERGFVDAPSIASERIGGAFGEKATANGNAKTEGAGEFWSRRYREEGHLWGDNPSMTGEMLNDQLKPGSNVLEIGFGYGRDLLHLLGQGHRVHGVEIAAEALSQAMVTLRPYLESGMAHVTLGNFKNAFHHDNFDAVLSHRVLHLLGQNGDVSSFVNRSAAHLRPGGLLFVSARDDRDFNPQQMIRHENGIVTYRDDIEKLGDRKGQLISLWNEERFRRNFERKFEILEFIEGNEAESINNVGTDGKPVQTYFTIMKARKRSEGLQLG